MSSPPTTYEDMTWQEVEKAASQNYLLILPVGSIEQHGPHLPLSTDVIIPYEISKALAKRTKAVVAPPIRYGYYSRPKSGGGEGFSGTTSISATTLIQTLNEIMKEFIRHGFRKFLILNGHFENFAVLPEGIEKAIDESGRNDIKAVIMSWGDVLTNEVVLKVFGNEFPGWEKEHAAISETSVMMFLRPDLVRTNQIPDQRISRNVNYDIIPAPKDTITESGSLWTARPSTQEKGEILFNAVVDGLLRVISTDF